MSETIRKSKAMTLRTFNYGGGVQSTAALVLAAQGKIDFKTFLFANVGDDSEHPATLAYVRDVAMPYAEANGIRLEELRRTTKDGATETLYARIVRDTRSIVIPVRMSESGAPGNRKCTGDFKIMVIAKWQREHGATPANPATSGLGISLDEFQRARSESGIKYQILEYPLLALRLTRQDCVRIIEEAGIPVPPKSSCWFCPFKSHGQFQQMRHDEPQLFWKTVELERIINGHREGMGRDQVFFDRRLAPLDQATSPHRQLPMLGLEADDACESGYCMT